MKIRQKAAAILFLIVMLFCSTTGLTQEHANMRAGFKPNQKINVADLDSVNLFDGSVTLAIPLGQSYSVNGEFSYQFKLIYGSNKLWRRKEFCNGSFTVAASNGSFTATGEPGAGAPATYYYPNGDWQTVAIWEDNQAFHEPPSELGPVGPRGPHAGSSGTLCWPISLPDNHYASTGLGWSLNFGRLIAPETEHNESPRWIYQDGTGAEHSFYGRLHAHDYGHHQWQPDDPREATLYSRDGSFLRMKEGASGRFRQVEFPSGETRHFENFNAGSDEPDWRLVKREDSFGNGFEVCYLGAGFVPGSIPGCSDLRWQVKDTHGRIHVFEFTDHQNSEMRVLSSAKLAGISSCDLSNPGCGQLDSNAFQTYTFTASERQIQRAYPTAPSSSGFDETYPDQFQVSFLDKVIYPDQSEDKIEYFYTLSAGAPAGNNGVIQSFTSGLGGQIAYVWKPADGRFWQFDPAQHIIRGYIHANGSSPQSYLQTIPGVFKRTKTDLNSEVQHSWKYEPFMRCREADASIIADCLYFPNGAQIHDLDQYPKEFINLVTNPDGTKTAHFFNTYWVPGMHDPMDPTSYNGHEYGLPMTKLPRDQAASGALNLLQGSLPNPMRLPYSSTPRGSNLDLFLSTAVFPINSDPMNEPDIQPLKLEYLLYEHDPALAYCASNDPVDYLQDSNCRLDDGATSVLRAAQTGFGEAYDLNRRVAARMTVYPIRPSSGVITYDQFSAEVFSDYNGLGSYRKVTQYGFDANGTAQVVPRSITTKYYVTRQGGARLSPTYPGSQQKPMTPADYRGYSMLNPNDPWLLNRYSETVVKQGSSENRQTYCFDDANGFLLRHRVLAGRTEAAHDLLTETTRIVHRDPDPLLPQILLELQQAVYGGDAQALNTGSDLCRIPLPTDSLGRKHAERFHKNLFKYGTAERVEHYTAGLHGELVSTSIVNRIDANTGLVRETTAENGITIEARYDVLHRPVKSLANDGSPDQVIRYMKRVAPNQNATVEFCIYPAGAALSNCGGNPLSYGKTEYDGFGNSIRQQHALPDDGTPGPLLSDQQTFYDYANRAKQKTTTTRLGEVQGQHTCAPPDPMNPHDGDPLRCRTVTQYDELGRVISLNPPGAPRSLPFSFTYNGMQRMVEKQYLYLDDGSGIGSGSIGSVERRLRYDRFGNLREVHEKSDNDDPDLWVVTKYDYDLMDRLIKVEVAAEDYHQGSGRNPRAEIQIRRFGYDGRGFLLWEGHPELATDSENKSIRYSYNANGQPLTRIYTVAPDGLSSTDLDQAYHYDALGRQVLVTSLNPYQSTPLKQFVYAREQDSIRFGVYSAGELVQAKRYNPENHTSVTDEFYFRSAGQGQVTERTTRISHANYSITGTQLMSYGQDGLLSQIEYPEVGCEGYFAECGPAGQWLDDPIPKRLLGLATDRGALTAVEQTLNDAINPTPLINSMSYYPNGLLKVAHYANDTYSRYEINPYAQARIHNIIHGPLPGPAEPDWHSGVYQYDQAGNIFRIGAQDKYAYDKTGRLSSASISVDFESPTSTIETRYAYDVVGNMQNRWVDGAESADWRQTSIEQGTNRLTSSTFNVSYDRAGNLTEYRDFRQFYNSSNQVTTVIKQTGMQQFNREYIYDANNERVAIINSDPDSGSPLDYQFFFRNGANQVIRELNLQNTSSVGYELTWFRDYIHRDGAVLASIDVDEATGQEHVQYLHLDHLGTPRFSSRQDGRIVDYREYLPFGEQASTQWIDQRLQFTGHERDANCANPPCVQESLETVDYMHARHYSPTMSRFSSVDPVLGTTGSPQSWNRYAYVLSNPSNFTDSTGESIDGSLLSEDEREQLIFDLFSATGGLYEFDENNNLQLLSTEKGASPTAVKFMNSLIASNETFYVASSNTGNSAQGPRIFDSKGMPTAENSVVFINFRQYDAIKYNKVGYGAHNSGTTLLHELYHAATGIPDTFDGKQFYDGGSINPSKPGLVVTFVNKVRAERNVGRRVEYGHFNNRTYFTKSNGKGGGHGSRTYIQYTAKKGLCTTQSCKSALQYILYK